MAHEPVAERPYTRIRIWGYRFVDPKTWKPRHVEDMIVAHPEVIAWWRDRLRLEPYGWTIRRTQLVREAVST